MLCCVRTRGRKEGDSVDQPAAPPGITSAPPQSLQLETCALEERKGKPVTGGGIKDGNMIVLAGAGVAVATTAGAAAVVVNSGAGSGACGVAGIGESSGGGSTSQGCCGSGGSCGCGGGCGGCGGCGG